LHSHDACFSETPGKHSTYVYTGRKDALKKSGFLNIPDARKVLNAN
jgi:hypothetical protein